MLDTAFLTINFVTVIGTNFHISIIIFSQVNEVETWFLNLIDDADVLASTKINILDYANIVGCTDAAIEDLKTFIMRTDEVERSILEVGVLRYPDLDNPFFKVTTEIICVYDALVLRFFNQNFRYYNRELLYLTKKKKRTDSEKLNHFYSLKF